MVDKGFSVSCSLYSVCSQNAGEIVAYKPRVAHFATALTLLPSHDTTHDKLFFNRPYVFIYQQYFVRKTELAVYD